MIQLPEKFFRGQSGHSWTMNSDAFLESYSRRFLCGIRINRLENYTGRISCTDRTIAGSLCRGMAMDFIAAKEQSIPKIRCIMRGFITFRSRAPCCRHRCLPVEREILFLICAPRRAEKSTALGARMNNQGLLVSNDISYSRAKALLKNIEAFGIKNSLVISEDPKKLASRLPEYFDKY